ncbi:LuxR C-terminal-related transcriptional regulator [Actinomadura keratinilytica]|uniref:LuxR C-terminal-related transcriptional regulator n=1 Tax=Actinomadura keratinilytica TaxID=547461 RepID=UPI0036231151
MREDTAPDAAPDAASGAGAGAVSAGDPPVPDVPVGRAVAELVDRARASGIPVTLVQQPPPPADPPEDTPGDTSGDTSGDRAGDTPGGTAGEGAAELARAAPGTAVAILTTFGEDEYIARALSGGASGFLLKSGDPHELIAGVRAVAGGAAYLSPKVAHRVITELRGGRLAHGAHARRRIAALTPRERQVLALVGAGLSNAEIASRLHVVEGTVKAYVSTILMRLEVRNRVQAAIVAYEAGLIDGTPAP